MEKIELKLNENLKLKLCDKLHKPSNDTISHN